MHPSSPPPPPPPRAVPAGADSHRIKRIDQLTDGTSGMESPTGCSTNPTSRAKRWHSTATSSTMWVDSTTVRVSASSASNR